MEPKALLSGKNASQGSPERVMSILANAAEMADFVSRRSSCPHSAEGLTEKRISSKVRKNAEEQKCHRKQSTKQKDWIIWE